MTAEIPALTEADWHALGRGPAIVFALVAGADEVVDAKEWAAFADALQSSSAEDAVVQRVMSEASNQIGNAGAEVGPAAEALKELAEVGRLARRLPADGLAVRLSLLRLGQVIAEASGKQLIQGFSFGGGEHVWRPSSGMSAHEREVLKRCAEALGVPNEETG